MAVKKNLWAKMLAALMVIAIAIFIMAPEKVSAADTSSQVVTNAEEFQNALSNTEVSKIVVSGEVSIATSPSLNRSVIIEGEDENAKLIFEGEQYAATKLKITYTAGMKVEIKNLKIDSARYDGVVFWQNDNSAYVNAEGNPAVLHVENCNFTNNSDIDFSTVGIGLFQSAKYNGAESLVEVNNCSFNGHNYGMYFNDESPQAGLSAAVTNCQFSDCYSGIYGIVANTRIENNEFLDNCDVGVQLILNKDVEKLQTTIENNVINAETAINMGPYHLNDGNALKESAADTVVVDADRLPVIKHNKRDVDANLVNLHLYRDGSSEYLTVAEGALDLTENYTAGRQPKVTYSAHSVAEGKEVIEKIANIELLQDELKDAIINDKFYVDADMDAEDLVSIEDIEAAQKVDELIEAIGPVDKVTLDSREAIVKANEGYKALTDVQKSLVTKYDVLQEAIDAYNALLEEETGDNDKEDGDKPNSGQPGGNDSEVDGGDKTDAEGNSPQTGDTAPIGILACALLLAGAGSIALKRRNQQ